MFCNWLLFNSNIESRRQWPLIGYLYRCPTIIIHDLKILFFIFQKSCNGGHKKEGTNVGVNNRSLLAKFRFQKHTKKEWLPPFRVSRKLWCVTFFNLSPHSPCFQEHKIMVTTVSPPTFTRCLFAFKNSLFTSFHRHSVSNSDSVIDVGSFSLFGGHSRVFKNISISLFSRVEI